MGDMNVNHAFQIKFCAICNDIMLDS